MYGGIDGAITTLAIVAGVVGADLSSRVGLILGIANVVADGVPLLPVVVDMRAGFELPIMMTGVILF